MDKVEEMLARMEQENSFIESTPLLRYHDLVDDETFEFIVGEVRRQGWDNKTVAGRWREAWMVDAWLYAKERYIAGQERPHILDMLTVAQKVEPFMNMKGFREIRVWIGDHEGLSWELIPRAISNLWAGINEVQRRQGRARYGEPMTVDDFYLEFESIHPFGDGNGRTGKIIWNWLFGTLGEGTTGYPELVHDYFGGGNP